MVITKETIMEQAQVFASGWSLVGGIFDNGHAIEDAEELKDELGSMVGKLVYQRDELLAALVKAENAIRELAAECDGDYELADELATVIATAKGGV